MTDHKAGIYQRISDDRAGLGLGVGRQDTDCTALCDRLGWTVSDRYVDNDTSAYSGKRRPQYERLLDDLKNGTITAIVAWHPDRLHRSPKELEHFIDLVEATGAEVATVQAGVYDLSTPSGRLMARTLGAFARYESEHKGERIRRKHLEIAQAGRRHGGGWRPFGFHDDRITLRDDEVDLVRDAARRVLAGEGLRGVCADWNTRGIVTTSGGPWNTIVLKRLLTAHSTAGLRELRGLVVPAVWPAVLDEQTWRQLRGVLLDPSRRLGPGNNARKYLLTGFLLCGRCDAKMVARPKQDRRRQYVCAKGPGFSGCGRMGALADPLEEAVEARLFDAVDSPRVVEAVRRHQQQTGADELLDQLNADQAALEQLARDRYVDNIISPAQFLAASQALEARVTATRRRLVRQDTDALASAWAGNGGALREAWPAMGVHQRRAVFATFVMTVRLGPAVHGRNRFDRDRITEERGGGISWRY